MRKHRGYACVCLVETRNILPALPLWESTRAKLAVRGKPRSGVRQSYPSPFPPCDLRASPQDRGGKPSPTGGEGKVAAEQQMADSLLDRRDKPGNHEVPLEIVKHMTINF
jgi:hypothetical protein